MTNILNKPYTNKQRADFAKLANSNGLRIEKHGDSLYALYGHEAVQDGEIVNISNTAEYLEKCRNCEIAKLLDDYEIKFAELKDSYLAKLGNGEDAISEYQTEYNVLKQELAAVLSSIGV